MEVYCLHHNDLDGRCAAAVVRLAEKKHRGHEVVTRGCAYKDDFGDFSFIPEKALVYVVDFSFQGKGAWEKLLERASKVIWFDHHKTAMEVPGPQHALEGTRKVGKQAACSLVWEHLCGVPIPKTVVLVSDYDSWTFQFENETRSFHAGMLIEPTLPESALWSKLFSEGPATDVLLERIQIQGKTVLAYQVQQNAEYLQSFAYPVPFEKHNAIVCNRGKTNSLLFASAEDAFDLRIATVFDGTVWTVSLYSKKVDVGAIAKKYGGGGHTGAAGFQCAELPFKVKKAVAAEAEKDEFDGV